MTMKPTLGNSSPGGHSILAMTRRGLKASQSPPTDNQQRLMMERQPIKENNTD
jgi:hypothetical protein